MSSENPIRCGQSAGKPGHARARPRGSSASSTERVASRSRSIGTRALPTGGWQLQPVFHVYQHERHRAVLEAAASSSSVRTCRSKGPQRPVRDRTPSTPSQETGRGGDHPVLRAPPTRRRRRDDFENFAAIVRVDAKPKDHLTERTASSTAFGNTYAMNAPASSERRSRDPWNPQRPYASRLTPMMSRRYGPSLMATWGLTRAKFLVG